VNATSFTAKTGQGWKVTAGNFSVAATLVAVGVSLFAPRASRFAADLAAIALGAVTITLYASIRCPRCRRSIGWHALRREPIARWYDAIALRADCPGCGHGRVQ
jgi:hypothetical protein